MKPRTIAGLTGAVVLGGLGYVALTGNHFDSYRVRRDESYTGETLQYADNGGEYIDATAENMGNLGDDLFSSQLEDDDDVTSYQSAEAAERAGKRRKKPGKGKGKAPKINGISSEMHDTMLKIHERHWGLVDLTLRALGIHYGRGEPDQFGMAPDAFTGYEREAPIVKSFNEEFGCRGDGSNIWNGATGPLDVWLLIPQEPILFSNKGGTIDSAGNPVFNEHIDDYKYYWQWFEKWIEPAKSADFGPSSPKLQVASYGGKDNVQFRLRAKLKSAGVWNIVNQQSKWFQTPKIPVDRNNRLYISQPDMPQIAAMLNRQKIIQSTPSAGYTSVVLWFIQNAPDMTPFQIPEKLEQLEMLHSRATVIPIGVGGNRELFRNLMAYVRPELQGVYSKDAEYTQYFHVNSPEDLLSDEFNANLNKFICLIQHRATCRLNRMAMYIPPSDEPTQAGPTEGFGDYAGGFKGIEGDFEPGVASTIPPTSTATTTFGTPRDVEIDSCCGHDQFTASPYDQSLRRCCTSGKTVSFGNTCP